MKAIPSPLHRPALTALASLCLLACPPAGRAAPANLDASFGTGGKVTTSLGDVRFERAPLAVQSDGKILVAGSFYNGTNEDFALVRFNANGSLDTGFNATGMVTTDFGGGSDYAYTVAVQGDGKILVAGRSANTSGEGFALVRYNANGSLDTGFNATGMVTTDIGGNYDIAYSVAVHGDGKILVAGFSDNGSNPDFALVRYNANGSLDTSFNATGKVITDFGGNDDEAYSVTVQGDGKILVAGFSDDGSNSDFALVRYNANGSLDTGFNATGKVITDFGGNYDEASSVAVQGDGKILVVGFSDDGSNPDFALVRYNANGSLDTSFNATGMVTTDIGGSYDIASSVAVLGNRKILVAGFSDNGSNPDFALVRYNANGSLDTGFNATGMVTTDFGGNYDIAHSVAVQGNGKILVAGTSDNGSAMYHGGDLALVRYEGDPVASASPAAPTDNWSAYYAHAWATYTYYASIQAYYLGLANYCLYTGYGEYYRHLGAGNPRAASASFAWYYGYTLYFFYAHWGDINTGASLLNYYQAYAASLWN